MKKNLFDICDHPRKNCDFSAKFYDKSEFCEILDFTTKIHIFL